MTSACGCVDCEASCPAPQPFPPLKPPTWKLFGLDGISILMAIICVFGNILIAFLVILFSDEGPGSQNGSCPTSLPNNTTDPTDTSASRNSNNTHHNGNTNHHDSNRLHPDGEVIIMYPLASTSLFHSAQKSIKKLFGVIGRGSASHPYLTLLVLIVPLALSTSLLTPLFKITTDPVELWANPHSRTRIEKKFFDKHFTPFFRTEQIIITSHNPPFTRQNSDGVTQKFGPVLQKEFLVALSKLQTDIENLSNGSLKEICLKPLETDCTIFSLMEYWQNDISLLNVTQNNDTYLDHFLYCAKNPTSPMDSTALQQSCMGRFGGPVDHKLVLGGIPKINSGTDDDDVFMLANSTVLTFVVRNHVDESDNELAKVWESAFISYMKSWSVAYESRLNISVAFNSERSVQDELSRESRAEATTILISYIIMFAYIAMSLGFGKFFVDQVNKCSWRRYFWWDQVKKNSKNKIHKLVKNLNQSKNE